MEQQALCRGHRTKGAHFTCCGPWQVILAITSSNQQTVEAELLSWKRADLFAQL